MLPCLCCGKALANAIAGVPLQPGGATAFTTRGHYGSGAFDPLRGDQQLQVNVCDECMALRAAEGRVAFLAMPGPARQPDPEMTIWHPEVA